MSKLHWMPLLVNNIRSSNRWRGLTKSQRGCYIDLLCIAWCNADCMLPASHDEIYRLADCYAEQDKLDTDHVLELCFEQHEQSGGRYFNAKQLEVFAEQSRKRVRRVAAAKRRWSNAECNAPSIAPAMQEHTASDSDSGSVSRSEKNGAAPPPAVERVQFPPSIDRPDCRAKWAEWCAFKKSRREGYKNAKSQSAMLKQLARMGPERFLEAIDWSMGAGYKGVFEPPTTRDGPKKSAHERNMEKLERARAEEALCKNPL